MKTLATNRRARFDYAIEEKLEAGLVLLGHEVKSVKAGRVSLKGSHVIIHDNEAYLLNAHIPVYEYASKAIAESYDPTRSRKLLLKRSQIKRLIGAKSAQGVSIVPLRIYDKGGLLKVEIGVGRGKKARDKRDDIKKREDERRMRRAMRE